MKLRPLHLGIVLGLMPTLALAQGADMAMFIVGNICLFQDSKYRTSSLGQTYSSSPRFPGWDAVEKTQRAKCIRAKQWISEQLCSDVLEVVFAKDSPSKELEALSQKHANELRGRRMQEAFEYFTKTLGGPAKADAVPCPSDSQ